MIYVLRRILTVIMANSLQGSVDVDYIANLFIPPCYSNPITMNSHAKLPQQLKCFPKYLT